MEWIKHFGSWFPINFLTFNSSLIFISFDRKIISCELQLNSKSSSSTRNLKWIDSTNMSIVQRSRYLIICLEVEGSIPNSNICTIYHSVDPTTNWPYVLWQYILSNPRLRSESNYSGIKSLRTCSLKEKTNHPKIFKKQEHDNNSR